MLYDKSTKNRKSTTNLQQGQVAYNNRQVSQQVAQLVVQQIDVTESDTYNTADRVVRDMRTK